MRKSNDRPFTAGSTISKRYEPLPRIWRPTTAICRKHGQDEEENENDDESNTESSSDEAYDSDSTVSASESDYITSRHCSAKSSSDKVSPTIKSEGELEDEECMPLDEFVKSKLEGLSSLNDHGCHFGEVSMEHASKRMEMKEPERCHCLANLMHYESDDFGPWKTTCRHRHNRQHKRTEQNSSNSSKMCQATSLYQKLYGNVSKSLSYPFSHFDNSDKYIQQYKELCSSVGKFKKAWDLSTGNKMTSPDPYLKKLRSKACSIAESFDVFAILAVEKVTSEKETSENNGDSIRSMTVNDRGKNLNLAPVRDSPPLDLSSQQYLGKPTSKNFTPFNQYLNLVIPKTTINGNNIQLHIDNPKDVWTPRFESNRNPGKHSHRRSESVDSHSRHSKKKSPDGCSTSRRFSGGNRASELRLQRAATLSAEGTGIRRESGCIIPPPAAISQNTSILTKRKTQIQKTKCVNQIRAMLSDLDSCKGKLDRTCRRFENAKLGHEAKHDRVIPATKTFGVEGQTCRTEDQLSIIHRLRKEKERSLRVSTVQ